MKVVNKSSPIILLISKAEQYNHQVLWKSKAEQYSHQVPYKNRSSVSYFQLPVEGFDFPCSALFSSVSRSLPQLTGDDFPSLPLPSSENWPQSASVLPSTPSPIIEYRIQIWKAFPVTIHSYQLAKHCFSLAMTIRCLSNSMVTRYTNEDDFCSAFLQCKSIHRWSLQAKP